MSDLPQLPPVDELAKLPADGGPEWNRLVFEQSPYLLQHARNPVRWFAWDDNAFELARKQDKPIFLSIGYATCHWCHVMARESFEDDEVAALLNEHFVAIKVDREERPDIDQVYMAACQAMTGHGGWPLTCFLMPNAEVFYAGTYYPKSGRGNQPGMMQLLPGLANAWQTQRADVLKAAGELTGHLRQQSAMEPGDGLDPDLMRRAIAWFRDNFDKSHGGFGERPKFPTPHQYLFLLRCFHGNHDTDLLLMVEQSLTAMRLGGLFDHVGLGFHRYSTDREWLLPHFEKMLYDQAMLLMAFSETYAATGKAFYRRTALEIVEYVVRDLTHPSGGFFSAEDADSDGEEGLFYVWSIAELQSVLNEADLKWFVEHFNLDESGNFVDEATREKTGANIPFLRNPGVRGKFSVESDALWEMNWQRIRRQLFECRESRNRPLLDDKVLTDWNGLMIAALARASLLLAAPELLDHAHKAWQFVLQNLTAPNDQLLKRIRNDVAGLPAHLDDYAFMIWAALEMHQATLDLDYLEQAIRWQQVADELFDDEKSGGYFFTQANTALVVRQKTVYDGAIPSGNSLMARNLAHLYHLTGDIRWRDGFDRLSRGLARQINHFAPGSAMMLVAADLMDGETRNLVFADDHIDQGILAPLLQTYLPSTVWIGIDVSNRDRVIQLAPFTASQPARDDPTLYLCEGFTCERPVIGSSAIRQRLAALASSPSDNPVD